MPVVERYRDVIVFFKGATMTVDVTEADATRGWVGGQAFEWCEPEGDRLLVTRSDGLYAGLALFGNDEQTDQYTAMTLQQSVYRYVTLMAGGWLVALGSNSYERYTYESRTSGGPLVPIDYHASDRLVLSLGGRLTIEDEWTLAGDPRAPNSYYIAFVSQRPTEERNWYLGVQLSI